MSTFLSIVFSLAPVLAFLTLLILLDSYKLVSIRAILTSMLVGSLVAILAYLVNSTLLHFTKLDPSHFVRQVSPLVEELLKAVWVVYLLRARKLGFLVDSAIQGFAVGAGFAFAENASYLFAYIDYSQLVWIVRGFGTAAMHGSTMAIFALMSKSFLDRYPSFGWANLIPGILAAIVIHFVFNQFILPPVLTTAVLLTILPLLTVIVFSESEKATRRWLGIGLDKELELLDLIASGDMSESRIGNYLERLRGRFEAHVIVDMLCFLRLNLELSIRAKGAMLLREAGLAVPRGSEDKDKLIELKFLEKSVGQTGKLAMAPFLRFSRRDLCRLILSEK